MTNKPNKKRFNKPKFKWDPRRGVGYITLKKGKFHKNISNASYTINKYYLPPFVYIDVDKENRALGVEIIL